MRRELQVYGRVGEGGGKCFRNPAEEEKGRRGRQRGGSTWGDRRKPETFQSRVDGTDPRTSEAASAAPRGNPENP